MRIAILAAAVLSVAACHKPSLGPKSLVSSAKSLGKKAAAIAGVNTKLDIKVAVKTDTIVALAKDQAQKRVAAIAPISINKSVHKTSVDSGAPPAVEPTITRTTVDTGGDQVWKNVWRDGE